MYSLVEVENIHQSAEFADILSQNLYASDSDADERNTWFYDGLLPSYRYLVYKDGVDNAIGTIGFARRRFRTPIGNAFGCIAADFSINKEHRNAFAAITLFEEATNAVLAKDDVDFIYTIPNTKSDGIIKRNKKFKEVGVFKRDVKLVQVDEFLQRKKLGALASVLNPAWRVASTVNLKLKSTSSDAKVLGEEFLLADDIWESKRFSPGRVEGERDLVYMNWRYGQDSSYKLFGSLTGVDSSAYLAYKVIKNRAYVVDLAYSKDNIDAMLGLFSAFEAYASTMRYSMIVIHSLGCNEEINALRDKFWYRPFGMTNKKLYVASHNEQLLSCLLSQDAYWLAGDEDAIE